MTHRVRVFPHNDLFNTAHYHLSIINEKIETGKQDAIALDCLSCIIVLSFGVEAFVNFLGDEKLQDWDEWQKFEEKIRKVHKAVGYNFNKGKEPFKTIWRLKLLRDSIAHGKPKKKPKVLADSKEELWAHMNTEWADSMNPTFVNGAYREVKEWKNRLLESAGIQLGATLTSATSAER